MAKVIAVYDSDRFLGYIKSARRLDGQRLDLTRAMWDCKTYLNELNASKAIAQYESSGLNYTFKIKDFEL